MLIFVVVCAHSKSHTKNTVNKFAYIKKSM